jgi:FAD/FMN-containing dehydrogenase
MLTGSLVVPGSPTYATGAELYNELLASHPAAIAYCATPTDVQRCVAFAREHGVALAARSGGHSYGGYSSCSGLVVDVTSLNAVVVGPGQARAVVGAGAHLIDIYSQLGSSGVLLPGGSCPTGSVSSGGPTG